MQGQKAKGEFEFPSKYVEVLGSKMHYFEQGQGDPILFLHGMPASSYVWRKLLPRLAELGHCIALDFIGMGKSDKPSLSYTLGDHRRYLAEFIKTLNLKNITLVMHGWGSLFGFDYAMSNEDNCKALVFYEAYLQPLQGDKLSLPYLEQLMLAENQFTLDEFLRQRMMHQLSEEELNHYREPFLKVEGEKALKQYRLELPRGDGKSKVDHLIADYSKKLTASPLPKLLLYSVPGFVTSMATVMWAKENLPELEIGDVGEELHFAQESEPELMADLISSWLQALT